MAMPNDTTSGRPWSCGPSWPGLAGKGRDAAEGKAINRIEIKKERTRLCNVRSCVPSFTADRDRYRERKEGGQEGQERRGRGRRMRRQKAIHQATRMVTGRRRRTVCDYLSGRMDKKPVFSARKEKVKVLDKRGCSKGFDGTPGPICRNWKDYR